MPIHVARAARGQSRLSPAAQSLIVPSSIARFSASPAPAADAVTRVGEQTDILGECLLWDERAEALYWVDIRRPAIRRLDYARGRLDTWTMPGLVGSIAFVAGDERLLVALPDRIAFFD